MPCRVCGTVCWVWWPWVSPSNLPGQIDPHTRNHRLYTCFHPLTVAHGETEKDGEEVVGGETAIGERPHSIQLRNELSCLE